MIDGTGGDSDYGEGLYLGLATGSKNPERNVQVYGNRIQNTRGEFINTKPNTVGFHIHHNICKNQSLSKHNVPGALVIGGGEDHDIHDNIFVNFRVEPEWASALMFLELSRNHKVYRNVFRGGQNVTYAIGANDDAKFSTKIEIYNNIFSNLTVYKNRPTTSRFNIHSNIYDASIDTSRKEEERILKEIKNLPDYPGSIPGILELKK